MGESDAGTIRDALVIVLVRKMEELQALHDTLMEYLELMMPGEDVEAMVKRYREELTGLAEWCGSYEHVVRNARAFVSTARELEEGDEGLG